MKYTKRQRREIAEAFRIARDLLAKQKSIYICLALCDARAIHVIESRMGKGPGGYVVLSNGDALRARSYALEEWLIQHKVVRRCPLAKHMREYRLRWLDALIEEFSS